MIGNVGERALQKAFRYWVDVVRIFAPEKLGKAVNTLVRPVVGQVPRHPDDIAGLIHEGGLGAGGLIGPKDESSRNAVCSERISLSL